MHHDWITLGNLLEHIAGTPSRVHKVLGDDFEPVYGGILLKNVVEMNGSQAHPHAQVRMAESFRDHDYSGRESFWRWAPPGEAGHRPAPPDLRPLLWEHLQRFCQPFSFGPRRPCEPS